MADERIEGVKRAIDAIRRGDVAAMIAELDESVQLRPLMSVWERDYRGHEGVERWWHDVTQVWDAFSVEADRYELLGDHALIVIGAWHARAEALASDVDGPLVALVRFGTEKPTSVEIYLDEESARLAASRAAEPDPRRSSS